MYACMYVGYICMGEHQIKKKKSVFFMRRSGPLDLLMYVWVTFGFLMFLRPWGQAM